MKKYVILFLCVASIAAAQTPIKKWSGLLDGGGQKIEVVLNFQVDSTNKLQSFWDIPAQKAKGIPSTKTEWIGSFLSIEIKRLGVVFNGKLSDDGQRIDGSWGQSGFRFAFKLEPYVEGKIWPVVVKPQTPKAPFPYVSEDFVYQGVKTKLKYGATLTSPKDTLRHPLLILISGSGAQDRDETIFDHKPFAVMADYFTRHGYAVMRVDDRSIGKSNGVFQASTSADFALDVEEHLNYAKKLPQIDSTKMGLVGHSEGGLIAPMVAVRNSSVAFVVLMAAPGVDILDLMAAQNELVLKSVGISKEAIEVYMPLYKQLMAEMKGTATKFEATEKATSMVQNWFKNTDKTLVKQVTNMNSEADINSFVFPFVESVNSKWSKYFMSYRPGPVLEKVTVPVLAINGMSDIQVPARQNLMGIRNALNAGNHKNFTIHGFDGLNHLFQKCKVCSVPEYGELDTTIEPEVLDFMLDWLLKRIR